MSQIYATKKKSAAPIARGGAAENISKSDMLRVSGAGAPQPMSPALREKFEPGFGADFSNIRVSRGRIPEEMGVQAVAKGTDILIDSRAGMDVLGHELAHVVQQAQGQVRGGFPVVHDAALERQADVMGARAASGLSAVEGGMPGFGGGEMMPIAPMSDASAPAQCKSRDRKKEEKLIKQSRNMGNRYDDKIRAAEGATAKEDAYGEFNEKMRDLIGGFSAEYLQQHPDLVKRIQYDLKYIGQIGEAHGIRGSAAPTDDEIDSQDERDDARNMYYYNHKGWNTAALARYQRRKEALNRQQEDRQQEDRRRKWWRRGR